PRRDAGADVLEGDLPGDSSGARHRYHARLRQSARRVRVGRVHLGQPAAQDRGHDAAHHDEAGAVRLSRRHRAGNGHARPVVRAAARDQHHAGLAAPAQRRGGGLMKARLVRAGLIGLALAFLALCLVMPLVAVFAEALAKGFEVYWASISEPEARRALWLTAVVAVLCVPLNMTFGIAAAWAIARFRFPGRQLLVTLIDLPFAVSPVISGLIFVLLFGAQSALGPWLEAHDITIIFAIPGIMLATLFVTCPFVARELIPVMEEQGADAEEAAVALGASGIQLFWRVTLPQISWGLMHGVVLLTARAVGEFGAVSVVSGHIRGLTNTAPLHVEILYNEYQFAAAFAVASVLSLFALLSLGLRRAVEWRMAQPR